MQAFKQFNAIPLARLTLACSFLYASMPALADDSAQITALQNKVNALEKELIVIKRLLKQNNTNMDSDMHPERELILSAKDQLTLKAGKSSIALHKNGRITLNGSVFDVKTTQETEISGTKIIQN